MAENMTEMQVEGTVAGAAQKWGGAHGRGIGALGLVAILVAALIVGVATHGGRAVPPAAPTIASVQITSVAPLPAYTQTADGQWVVTQVRDDGTVQTGFIGGRSPGALTQTQQRFMENNTTNLPNAATAETLPVAASAQQRFGPAEHDQIHSALEIANGVTASEAASPLLQSLGS